MTKSFIKAVNELAEVSTQKEKEKLSDEAYKALLFKKEQAGSIIVPIVESFKRSSELKEFKNISESEFYDLEVYPYFDGDKLRISIQISFLQDYEEPIEEFSDKVALFLLNDLIKRNLDILVNDICINDVQYRNGVLR